MPKLKSCPFCGADSYSLRVEKFGINIHLHRAGCGVCLAEGPLSRSEEEAFAVWNTRADEVRVRKETIEECITIISQNTPMEGCAGCETRLYEKLRVLTPDSGKGSIE